MSNQSDELNSVYENTYCLLSFHKSCLLFYRLKLRMKKVFHPLLFSFNSNNTHLNELKLPQKLILTTFFTFVYYFSVLNDS